MLLGSVISIYDFAVKIFYGRFSGQAGILQE